MFHQHHINPKQMRGLSAESAHHERTFDHGITLVGKGQSQDLSVLTVSNMVVSLLILLLNKEQNMESPRATTLKPS